MKHTPEQLAGMSDFELNKVLNDALGFKLVVDCDNGAGEAAIFTNIHGEHGSWVDYCTDWAATGPLMAKYQIGLTFYGSSLCNALRLGSKGCPRAECTSRNPLRAVVECLILVLQEG